MGLSTYKALPLEGLFDLLIDGIRKLLAMHDAKENETKEFNGQKKFVEVLVTLIEEKKKDVVKIS